MVTDRKVFPVANTVGARIPNTHSDFKWLNVLGFQMVFGFVMAFSFQMVIVRILNGHGGRFESYVLVLFIKSGP